MRREGDQPRLQGPQRATVVHLCFGYAAVVRGGKPTGYAFLPQLADSIAQQISIRSAQPKIDLGVLKDLAPKKIMLVVIGLNDPEIETPQKVAGRIRAGLKYVPADKLLPAPDLRHEIPAARDRLRKAEVARRGARSGARRASVDDDDTGGRGHGSSFVMDSNKAPLALDLGMDGRGRGHDGQRAARPPA